MKYLIGYEDGYTNKWDGIARDLKLIDDDKELVTKLCETFGLDENTKVEEISVLDIIPGMVELMLGIPAEIITKPMVQLTAEDEKIVDDAFDRIMTVYTSNK